MTNWDPSVRPPPLADESIAFYVGYSFDTWKLHDCKVQFKSAGNNGPWSMGAKIMAQRVPDFFLFNIVGLLFLIVMFAASVVGIPYNDFADRLSTTMTLLLTAVAFKFVTNSWVPAVSYLTLLDKYTMLAICMIMLQVLENFICVMFEGDDVALKDSYFALTYVCVWVSFHIYIYIGTYLNWFCLPWSKVIEEDDAGGSYVVKNEIADYE
jgi:hypothetical protein